MHAELEAGALGPSQYFGIVSAAFSDLLEQIDRGNMRTGAKEETEMHQNCLWAFFQALSQGPLAEGESRLTALILDSSS
jgi:hypothetical protein